MLALFFSMRNKLVEQISLARPCRSNAKLHTSTRGRHRAHHRRLPGIQRKAVRDRYQQRDIDGRRFNVCSFPGLNTSPSWSPVANRLAVALSKDGNSEIYTMTRDGRDLAKVGRGHRSRPRLRRT